ncbi:hypothetical protein H257_05274 [Aphanomyces astaci]|nr:hypothetical protein H257_05274 [Aphanomyces astaci]ETV81647.1 hypothetical protein H257_05274 [Aphanomyces astaci]|eukprot:XP_009828384.1 hypothetical protein H257_05274 [Aphanomyces astaci]
MLGIPQYEQWFSANLRCGHATFTKFITNLRAEMSSEHLRSYTHSFEKKVHNFLYFLGSEGGYRETAAAFGVSKSWCVDIVHWLSTVMLKLASKWIYLPKSKAGWFNVESGFKTKHQIPSVVGTIDGTLVDIQRPKDYDGIYNRNGDPSLNIRAVVDSSTRFMSVDIRPASFSDKNIWKVSALGRTIRCCVPTRCCLIGEHGTHSFRG